MLSGRVERLRRHVMELMSSPAFAKLYYHNIIHTNDVYESSKRYAEEEQIEKEYVEPLLAAALLHDIGYAKQYDANEPIGAEMAGEMLPKFGFDSEEVKLAQKLILATEFPQHPKDELEYIICDADLDTLGTDRFLLRSLDLMDELEANKGKRYTLAEWYRSQLSLLESHKYFTNSARRLREEGQNANIEKVRKLLKSEG
ncbi:MAG: HD domain-containing protein [Candidatus Micrarchaeia archaeon]